MGGAGAGGIEGDKIYGWGRNSEGQLGLGNTTNVSSPNQIGSLSEWYDVSASYYATFAIKGDNTLWSWGQNNSGVLGLGTGAGNRSSPVQVGTLSNWAKVDGSGFYSCAAIKTNGTLWTWGENTYGGLGLGDILARSSPVQVGSLTNWSKVGFGAYHCLSIKTDGTLWVWGGGFYNYGQLGLGDTTNRSSPTQVGSLTNWSQACGGYDWSLAVKTDGTLWSWGANSSGQLGLGDTTNRSSPVQVGSLTNWAYVFASKTGAHSLAVKTNGTLWAWGYNALGELGTGNTTSVSSPVQVGSLTNWSKIFAGYENSVAIKTDGTIWAWGNNSSGQLGLSDTTNRSSPVQVGSLTTWTKLACGSSHTLALSD